VTATHAAPVIDAVPAHHARREHVPVLDGLRAVAILLVLMAHMPWADVPRWLSPYTYRIQPGYMGVDLFFVLSGFLITRILLVDRERGRPLTGFLLKRALRIFPIYYLTILVFLFIWPGQYLLWCALYLSNFYYAWPRPPTGPIGHTWSLAVEEHFYLIWPLIVMKLPRAAGKFAAFVGFPLLAIGSAAALLLYLRLNPEGYARHFPGPPGQYFYLLTNFRAFSLALGACAAYGENVIRRTPATTLLFAGAAFAAFLVCTAVGLAPIGIVKPAVKMITIPLFSLSLLLVALWLSALGKPWSFPLDNPVGRYIGKISYGLYLYHVPIFDQFHLVPVQGEENAGNMRDVPLAVAISIAAATISYFAIERPILKLKDRIRG